MPHRHEGAEAARDVFLDAWVSMASLFSFSPSTARVSALLITTGRGLTALEISDRLGLSRGNVSMCLKELRAWGIVDRSSRRDDRREVFESRGDLFEQMFAIARERKRREFDPIVGGALKALSELATSGPPDDANAAHAVADFLRILDRVGRDLLRGPGPTTAPVETHGGDR